MSATRTGGGTTEAFTRNNPCPICGGSGDDRRGQGVRCFGFLGSDGEYGHCTREDHAGSLPVERNGSTYAHRLRGECRCGRTHGATPEPTAARGTRAAGTPKPGRAFANAADAVKALAKSCGKVVHQWSYHYADGTLALRVVRFERPEDGEIVKTYRPIYQAADGWRIGDPPGELPLYRLQEINADRDRVVWVYEGEKCGDAGREFGQVATTPAHGAQSPHRTDWSPLAGRDVVIVPDCDQAGEAFTAAVAGILVELDPPARVRVVRLAGLAAGEDVVEWRARGGTADQIRELADAAEPMAPKGADKTDKTQAEGVSSVLSGGETGDVPKFEGPPRPLVTDLLPVPPLVPELIPSVLRPWLTDIAERGCFPLEYPAAAAMVALASLVGRDLAIRPKRHDDWAVVPNLWGAIVGPPGIQKSPAVDEAFRHIKRLVAEALEAHETAAGAYDSDLMVREAQAKAAKTKLEVAARKGADADELRRLAAEATGGKQDPAPTLRRYMVNDTTVEKLGEILAQNPRGLLLFRDELAGFFKSMDRQGHETDRQFYLESWNGGGSFVCDRIGRGTTFIKDVCLSVFGTIQPGPLARYLRDATSGEDADGFIPRFQLMVYPDPPGRFVNVDRYPDTRAKDAVFALFKLLDGMDYQARGCRLDQERGVPYLNFAPDAQEFFDGWRCDLENRLREGSENPALTAHLAKYRSLLPSLALVFHLVETIDLPHLPAVTLDAAELAAAWVEFLEAHARRTYQAAFDGNPESANRLGERIKQSLPNPFTYRNVARKGWSGLDTVEDVRRAVGVLEDRDWVKVVELPAGPQGGRPSEQVWINPALLGVKIAEEVA